MDTSRDNESNKLLASVDWFTVLLYLVLVVAGAISIYAATTNNLSQVSIFDFNTYSGKQFLWIGLSFVIGFALLLIDRRMYEGYAYLIYIIMIVILIATAFLAPNIKGSHSWLKFGAVSIQPAEFAKTATALALAKLFSTYGFKLGHWRTYIVPLAIIFIPVFCILLESETGSALVYISLIFVLYREGMSGFVLYAILAAVTFFVVTLKFASQVVMGIPMGYFIVLTIVMITIVLMLFFYCRAMIPGRNVAISYIASALLAWGLSAAGVNINGYVFFFTVIPLSIIYLLIAMFREDINKILITIAFAVMSIIFMFSVNAVFNNVLATHQQNRIKVSLGIMEDVKDKGYNVNQSKIAIGSGGFTGKGFLKGTQTKLNYVPEQHTDFIFCTIGEEEGFLGTSAVMLLFLLLILRVIAIAERQHTAFGRVYAYCVAAILIFHVTINIGMVIGLVPVIGIPLPFFSYGGSSLWGFTIMLFILLRIDAARAEYGTW
ncbi:MAG: rod shape-determining protein RodA [Muribaculaceae bacterium]|nr:rod shape-determining protein RodA [Muribaculaceae bacterium]MBR5171397.1 rod shape-determining protein RodA [Muribaculaceae bacterium]